MSDEARMTLRDHLLELRRRLAISLIAVVVATGVGLFFANSVLDLMKQQAPSDVRIIYTDVTEGFNAYLKTGLYAGIGLALPVLVYQLLAFIAPGLTRKERKYLFALMPGVFILFIAGASFCYFIILPFALRYLLGFTFVAEPMIRIGDFIGFTVTFLFWVGIVFETPLIIFFLSKVGIVNPKKLGSYRKWAFLASFIIGALITPTPDPINQSLVAIPIYILFEAGLLMARIF